MFTVDDVVWVLDEQTLEDLEVGLETEGLISFDLETTGLHEFATYQKHDGSRLSRAKFLNEGVPANIVLASFTMEETGTTFLLPLSHPESPWRGSEVETMRRVARRMAANRRRLVGHNIKFDARWVHARTGVDISKNIFWDSQVAAHLLDETQSTKLKEVVPRMFDVERWDDDIDFTHPGAAWEIPLIELGLYAARDTFWALQLAIRQREEMFLTRGDQPMFPDEIEKARLGRVAMLVSMPTVRSLTAVEQRGFTIDIEKVRAEIEAEQQRADELHQILVKVVDMDPNEASWAPTSTWFKQWAEKAVDAGKLRIGGMTKTGTPQWSKAVLGRLARRGYETAQQLLDLRQATKRLEYLRSWLYYMTGEGKIHSSYHVGSVATGRLSSSGPNMQQVTRALRPCFVASEGHVLIDLDYSQIEMRVAAFLSDCEPMIDAFVNGLDTHTLMASAIVKKAIEDVTEEERQRGKSANFGLLFGMGWKGYLIYAETAYGVILSEQEAREAHEAYFTLWEGLKRWHERQTAYVRQHAQVVSPIGRVRRLPFIWSGDEEKEGFAIRAAINSPVQGFASDLMQVSAALIEGSLEGYCPPVKDARIVATVHDSIVVEAPAEQADLVAKQCTEIMEKAVLEVMRDMDCHFTVPLKADAKIGYRWGE